MEWSLCGRVLTCFTAKSHASDLHFDLFPNSGCRSSRSCRCLSLESCFIKTLKGTKTWGARSFARRQTRAELDTGLGRVQCTIDVGGHGWTDWGSSNSRRSSTAVGAGRSKAKKGQTSGGRIEKYGQEKNGGAQKGAKESSPDEEDLNATWESAGLGDRRSGGKFQPERPQQPKEPLRIGGWGKDKSMQRIVTPDRFKREQEKRANRRERKALAPPPKQKRMYPGFDDDPNVIHPPDYYIYGPYGPHAWKGIPVGNLIPGTYATNQVVFFSNVADDADDMERAKANMALRYSRTVDAFDESIGIQYFYAFARSKRRPRTVLWKDWSLVAQIAIQSREKIDSQELIFKNMGRIAQDLTAQCIAWARPDIVYVRRPVSQLRLEPQEDFYMELLHLVDPRKDSSDSESFYGTLCKLLNIDIEADPSDVMSAYDSLKEENKLRCLEHVFTNNPVKVLPSSDYDSGIREQRKGNQVEDFPAITSFDNVPTLGRGEERGVKIPDELRNVERSSNIGGTDKEGELIGGGQGPPIDAWETEWGKGSTAVKHRQKLWAEPALKAAVRPFTYANVVEEIVRLRCCLRDGILQP